MRTVVTAGDVAKSARSLQGQIVAWLSEHGQEADDCLAIAHEPGNGYVPDDLTLTYYDRNPEGQILVDPDTGGPAAYSVRIALQGELPEWWSRIAKEAKE